MAVIFTADEMKQMYEQNGIRVYSIGEGENRISINWNKKVMNQITFAQLKINEVILTKKLNACELTTLKKILRVITDDITNLITSVCSVCGDKQSLLTHINIEHITIKKSWGFGSLYDANHELVLCDKCYDEHIMTPLRKFVAVDHY